MLTHSTVNLASVQTHRALAAACDVKVGEVREREQPCLCAPLPAEIGVAWPKPAPTQPKVKRGATTYKTERDS